MGKHDIIRLFSVISRILIGVGVLLLCRDAVGLFYSLSRLGNVDSEVILQHIEANPAHSSFWFVIFMTFVKEFGSAVLYLKNYQNIAKLLTHPRLNFNENSFLILFKN